MQCCFCNWPRYLFMDLNITMPWLSRLASMEVNFQNNRETWFHKILAIKWHVKGPLRKEACFILKSKNTSKRCCTTVLSLINAPDQMSGMHTNFSYWLFNLFRSTHYFNTWTTYVVEISYSSFLILIILNENFHFIYELSFLN